MKILKTHKCFEGQTQFWEHESSVTKTKMNFSTFTPAGRVRGCVIWLSGLTCTDENFMAKAGAQRHLAEAELMVICPDTSPRGLNLPGEHDGWDFGSGASFYVDATTPGYRDHYRMESYVTSELYGMVRDHFKAGEHVSIMGHSMGGHGALTLGLRHPEKFKSVSAFSPIVNPVECPWGQKAFAGYFGEDRALWKAHDTTELIRAGHAHANPILIDQGTEDQFLAKELLTDNLVRVAAESNQRFEVRYQDGYDHSYYFISTFVRDHVRFHAEFI
jgi:S-formylglutathione hydrolase